MVKFYIKFIILLFLYNCSYQPIFTDKQYNFEFKNIYLSGQDHISNLLKKNLKKLMEKRNMIFQSLQKKIE